MVLLHKFNLKLNRTMTNYSRVRKHKRKLLRIEKKKMLKCQEKEERKMNLSHPKLEKKMRKWKVNTLKASLVPLPKLKVVYIKTMSRLEFSLISKPKVRTLSTTKSTLSQSSKQKRKSMLTFS